MDIGKSFSYPIEDDQWVSKLLIGAIVNAVPILNFAFTGYTVDIVRNVSDGELKPLPDWVEFGDKFVKGFLIWAAGFIYSLPAIIVACLPIGLLAIPVATSEGSNFSETFFSVFTGIGIFLVCLLAIYVLLLSFYLPAVYINFARKGSFGSCFEIREIFSIVSRNLSQYITAWLIFIVGAIIISVITSIVWAVFSPIICIGWIIAWVIGAVGSVYTFAIGAHLFGQVGGEVSPPSAITGT
jgi:hypothetical protein